MPKKPALQPVYSLSIFIAKLHGKPVSMEWISLPNIPSDPGGVQGPVNPSSRQDVQEKQDVTGKHGIRKVEETAVEKKILVNPRTSPRKRLSEFNSIKPVTPEPKQVASQKTDTQAESIPAPKPPITTSPEEGVETLRGDDRYQSRESIIRVAKKSKAWKQLESQITKKGKLVSKKRLAKLLLNMPKMDFSNKRTVNLMALFAIEKFDSGKFTEAQVRDFMETVVNSYVQAKADEQVSQALFMLPPAPKKGSKAQGLGRTAILAEIAAMTAEKSKGTDAHEAAFRALKTELQIDLYDRNSTFLAELTKGFSNRVTEINEKIAEGMEREMGRLLIEETGSKKRKMSPKQKQKMVDDVDLMVKQFVESQMREKKQKIDGKTASGEELAPITDVVLQKAATRKAGMIAVLTQTAGPDLQAAFEQHEVPESRQPGKVVDTWLKDNEAAKRRAEAQEVAAAQAKKDTPGYDLDKWVDEIVRLVPEEHKHRVNDEFKEVLRDKIEPIAQGLDILEGLVSAPLEKSPFSRNDPLRKGIRRREPDPFKPVQKTVTESLETAINKELAKRAARRAEAELEQSRPRPEPGELKESTVVSEKKVPSEVTPKPVRGKQTESVQPKKHRELEGDGLVPTLVRQFEQIITHEKQRVENIDRPAPTEVHRPRS